MEQSTAIDPVLRSPADPAGAAHRVYLGIMRDLEHRRIVPGQRLVESDLARQYAVGRNAVREAMQRLAGRGVVDLSRHRSATIRLLDVTETMEILDVAEALTGLVARSAAQAFAPSRDGEELAARLAELAKAAAGNDAAGFSRARRRFYRTLLSIGGNRELQRIFPAIGMHIIYSQFQSQQLQAIRLADYSEISSAVAAGEDDTADRAGRMHVERVRQAVLNLVAKGHFLHR